MHKTLQKKQGLNYSENIFDIVQFGSSIMRGNKPNDIDIAVIFKSIPLKQQLEESQQIKKQLAASFSLPIHMSSYDLYSLFNEGNFAREGILFYGKSLISSKYFASRFGLTPRIQLEYSLSHLEKKDKVRFNYLLNGKKGEYGLLREYNGRLIKPGLIEIEPPYENIFVESIKKIISTFKVNKVFKQS